jgi:hypothetical protein
MGTASEDPLIGASPREEELYDALVAHETEEQEVIAAYEDLIGATTSEMVRYLGNLILEDERRHHGLLRDLRNRVRSMATFEDRRPRVPFLDVTRGDKALLALTRRFLAMERKDRAHLERIGRATRGLGGEVDSLVVGLLVADTERHIRILRFIEDHVRAT